MQRLPATFNDFYGLLSKRRQAGELILISIVAVIGFSLGCAVGRLSTPSQEQHQAYAHAHGRYGVFP